MHFVKLILYPYLAEGYKNSQHYGWLFSFAKSITSSLRLLHLQRVRQTFYLHRRL